MKCKTQTESYLRNVALPQATKSYTPIAHGDIIDEVRAALKSEGFIISSELYKAEQNGEVAAGFMEISDKSLDADMAMTFNWTNSYNKMLRFSCGIGGLIYDNNVPFVSRDAQVNWARKHTGTAKEESTNVINQMINQAVHHFTKIVDMKDRFKAIVIDRNEYSKLMGFLFFDKSILGIEQSTQIRNEYNNPSFDYSGKGTLWEVYKMIMFGVKEQSPKTWYKQQIEINTFITLRYYNGVPGQYTLEVQKLTVNDDADLTSLNSPEEVDMNAAYEKQMAGRDEDNYYVGTDDEAVDNSPQINGVPNGDTMSDTDDTEPELVDVAFEDDGKPVPVYDDGAGNVDYPEIDADAEMQNLKTEQVIEEREEEETPIVKAKDTKPFPQEEERELEMYELPVYDEDRIAESIREDEAAVAEVCDERIIVTEDTPPLTADQLSSAVFEENESEDDFDMVVDAPSIEMTDEQIELLKEEHNQIVLPTPVEEPTLPLGGDDFNSCPPPADASEKEEESIASKAKTVYDEPVQEVLDEVYPTAEVEEISEVDGVTFVDLDSDEFFVLD
jgi:hypothetical protein